MKKGITYSCFLVLLIFSQDLCQAQELFTVERVPFSKREYYEYAPLPYQGNIVFTAEKRIKFGKISTGERNQFAANLFIVRPLGDNDWSEPAIFATELSDVNINHGWATFNERGNRMYFTRNYDAGSKETMANAGIYYSGYAGGQWTGVQPFQYNDPAVNLIHPSLSGDGNMLFFASDMPGGEGGFDIYVCTMEGNTWGAPENLGPAVNTRRHQIYPVYHENGRLYFSSNDHPGQGGYDIYYTENVDGEWIVPVNLPAPINTRRNEGFFVALDTTHTRGYLTSNRERSRTNSIFEFNLDVPAFDSCRLQEENNYCFTFYEAGTMDMDTTNYMYEWLIEEERFREESVDYCFRGIGDYIIQLNVIDMISGEVMFNEATYELNIVNIEQVYITSPDTVYANETIALDGNRTSLDDFQIDRFYWDMGDLTWVSDSTVTHTFHKPGKYKVSLGVTSIAETPETVQKACSFKEIVVISREESITAVREEN
ncbi:MAG: PD40 domain-containing protein [Bacteroidales bacterium]|nr:PD40 domain-containing protein [Bacteroidales bacterium]